MKKDKLKDVKKQLWPKTKKELEKAIKNTKELIAKGESYIKAVSEKGANNVRKLSLRLKREKLYYGLGKQSACLAKSKWNTDKKIGDILKEIKSLDREIENIR